MMSASYQRDFRQAYRSKLALKSHVSIVPPQSNKSLIKSCAPTLYEKVSIYQGSILDDEITAEVEAVVNPANERLWTHDAGVCGAIFRSAGYEELQQACNAITDKTDDSSIPTGQTVLTSAFNIKGIKWILHTVAPCEQNKVDLESCYITVLELCVIANIRSIAFPCIGTGDAGFSKSAACASALRIIHRWFVEVGSVKYSDFLHRYEKKPWHHNLEMEDLKMEAEEEQLYVEHEESVADRIANVVFCCYDSENMQIYQQNMPKIFPTPSHLKHSYLWKERTLLQHIHSLEMENEKLKEEAKEDQAANVLIEPQKVQQIGSVLQQYLKQYTEVCSKEHIDKTIKEQPQNLPMINQELTQCRQHLQQIRKTTETFLDEIESMQVYIKQNSVPDTRKYKEWNADEIVMWIISLEDGKFVPYIEQLRNGFVRSQTVGEELPEMTRPDLSVPPFSIDHWKIKKELVSHFQSLTKMNHDEEEGSDDQADDTNTTH